jgi:hypothetical protein
MALTTAVGLGAVAAVVVPWLAAGHDDVLGGVLTGELVRIPLGGGFELHWSWLVFCVVTLIAWGSLAASRQN